jgi:hypothetical protein
MSTVYLPREYGADMMRMNATEQRTPREIEIDNAREGWDTEQVEYLDDGMARPAWR